MQPSLVQEANEKALIHKWCDDIKTYSGTAKFATWRHLEWQLLVRQRRRLEHPGPGCVLREPPPPLHLD